MASEIVMPQLGWTTEGGTFGKWLKKDGDVVQPGDPVCVVESDKAAQEVESFDGGILRIPPDSPPPGTAVPVGTVLAYLVQPGEPALFEVRKALQEDTGQETPEPGAEREALASVANTGNRVSTRASNKEDGPTISPRALRVAGELGVDWTGLQGSGRSGRIVERDVRAAAMQQPSHGAVSISPVARRMAEEAGIALAELVAQKPGGRVQRAHVEAAMAARREAATPPSAAVEGTSVPITSVRRTIAQRMVESANTTAAVTLNTEADATELVALRQHLKATFEPRDLAVPTYTDLLIMLTAQALQEYPMLNAVWKETEIVVQANVHIGIAVDTEVGLLVPVLRDVPSKSLRQIAEEAAALAEKARARRLEAGEMQGGTFTITNLGMYGIDAFTPLINLPQCAILGVGRIVSKPVVHNEQVVPRQMMALSLTFDHRVVDGGPAARFLNQVREYIEHPGFFALISW